MRISSNKENACCEEGRKKFAVLETKRVTEVAEIRRFFEALRENPGHIPQGVAGSHRVHQREAEQAFGDNGAKAKVNE